MIRLQFPRELILTFIRVTGFVGVLAAYQTYFRAQELDVIIWRSKWIVLEILFLVNVVAGLIPEQYFPTKYEWTDKHKIFANKLVGIILSFAGLALPWLTKYIVFKDTLPQLMPFIAILLWSSLFTAVGLFFMNTRWDITILFWAVILTQASINQINTQFLVVTDYPFSVGYSEASRHYYASAFFADQIYGVNLPLPFLHPSRYLLMSLPFLVSDLPLWCHRFWQAFLWVALTGISALVMTRRTKVKGLAFYLLSAWVFLFYFQGAVYYHLQVCVILILAGVDKNHSWRSFLFILLASAWAGISRVNWFPVPAILAIAIYLLEVPSTGKGLKYWLIPLVWGGAGLMTAILSQFIYMQVSGNADLQSFGSSFTSDLLWNRLLPNETTQYGVLPMILLVSFPVFWGFFQMIRGRSYNLQPLRWFALFLLLLILFLGGLLVSTKIGGGGDLHNLDAYLVLLVLLATTLLGGGISNESGSLSAWNSVGSLVLTVAIIIPVVFSFSRSGDVLKYDRETVANDLKNLQDVIDNTVANGGEVLFVTERQLLTFNMITGVTLVPEYEQIELMEMAMSGNREYLEAFYQDLRSHRFDLIIAENQNPNIRYQGAFMEEGNVWARYIASPLLCNYVPDERLKSVNLRFFFPANSSVECGNPFKN